LPTNADSVRGINAAAFTAYGQISTPFSYTIAASGGTAPYNFSLTAGSLPPGLTLAANGQISGTPTQAGTYVFDYQIQDAVSSKTVLIGRVDIGASGTIGDVPLPGWALLAMAMTMAAGIYRRLR